MLAGLCPQIRTWRFGLVMTIAQNQKAYCRIVHMFGQDHKISGRSIIMLGHNCLELLEINPSIENPQQ